MTLNRTHLDHLENQSIFIFREAYHAFKNIAMPWSMGKDSNVLIWLARKAFFGRVPFPVLHIDTTYEFLEMLEFREWAKKHHNLNLIVKIRRAQRNDIFHRATRSSNGITKTNRRNSGDNSQPARPKASTFASNHCSIGPKSMSGATSSVRIFRSRKCISRETGNGSVR